MCGSYSLEREENANSVHPLFFPFLPVRLQQLPPWFSFSLSSFSHSHVFSPPFTRLSCR